MNLPNKLTVARIIAVPFFIAAYLLQMYIVALVIFIVASLTDLLDGKLARKYNLVTNFGKIMDPLADKILVYSAISLMVGDGTIPAWMLIVILAREFTIAGIRQVSAAEGIVIAAAMSGKIKTVLQMTAVIVLMVAMAITEPLSIKQFIGIAGIICMYAAVIMTIYSGIEYIVKNKNVFKS